MERENKKLRNQIEDLDEQLEKKNQQTSAMVDSDLKSLQFEVSEKNKVSRLIASTAAGACIA